MLITKRHLAQAIALGLEQKQLTVHMIRDNLKVDTDLAQRIMDYIIKHKLLPGFEVQ